MFRNTVSALNLLEYPTLSELSRLGRSTLQVLRSLDILHESKGYGLHTELGLICFATKWKLIQLASIMVVTVLAEIAEISKSPNIQYQI